MGCVLAWLLRVSGIFGVVVVGGGFCGGGLAFVDDGFCVVVAVDVDEVD